MSRLVISEVFRETAKKNKDKQSLGKKDESGEYKYISYKELEEKVEQKVKRVLSPEHIQKLVEGRRKKLEKKKLEKENPQSLDS